MVLARQLLQDDPNGPCQKLASGRPRPAGANRAWVAIGAGAAGRTRAGRPLTVREHSLFRATTRRTLRAATVFAGITLAALTPFITIGMMLLIPERQLQLVAIFGIEGMIGLCATFLALRRWGLPPLPLAFALALSATVTTLCLVVLVPEIRTPSLMLLALLPPAVALFLPWGVTVQAAWLLAGACRNPRIRESVEVRAEP